MAAKQAASIGRRSVKPPVSSVAKMMLLAGTAQPPRTGLPAQQLRRTGKPVAADHTEKKTTLQAQNQHGGK
jgi:hypothetical protein